MPTDTYYEMKETARKKAQEDDAKPGLIDRANAFVAKAESNLKRALEPPAPTHATGLDLPEAKRREAEQQARFARSQRARDDKRTTMALLMLPGLANPMHSATTEPQPDPEVRAGVSHAEATPAERKFFAEDNWEKSKDILEKMIKDPNTPENMKAEFRRMLKDGALAGSRSRMLEARRVEADHSLKATEAGRVLGEGIAEAEAAQAARERANVAKALAASHTPESTKKAVDHFFKTHLDEPGDAMDKTKKYEAGREALAQDDKEWAKQTERQAKRAESRVGDASRRFMRDYAATLAGKAIGPAAGAIWAIVDAANESQSTAGLIGWMAYTGPDGGEPRPVEKRDVNTATVKELATDPESTNDLWEAGLIGPSLKDAIDAEVQAGIEDEEWKRVGATVAPGGRKLYPETEIKPREATDSVRSERTGGTWSNTRGYEPPG